MIFTISSCTDDSIAPHQTPIADKSNHSNAFRVAPVEDGRTIELKANISAWENTHPTESSIEFNYDVLYSSTLEGQEGEAIYIHQVGYNESGPINYIKAFLLGENDEILEAIILKNSAISDNVYQLDYIDRNGDIFLTSSLNYNNQTAGVLHMKPWGQATADCLGDAYSNHGWVSVWATVQTAFIPATAVALAAACAIHNF